MKSIKLFMMAIALILAFSVNLVMAQENFDSTAAEEEGYWYSRYNLGNLVMRSGMGETFMPDMQMMMMAMQMADADFDPMQKGMYGDGNHPMPPVNAAEKAYAIRGLIEAKRTLGGEIENISSLASEFLADFDRTTGIFQSQNTYTIDDVVIIIGALNAMRIFESAEVDTVKAEEVFTLFFETILNKAGMQQSAPPIMVGMHEGDPEIYFKYPGMPLPPMAGGQYGIAPMFFASSVTYKDGKWEIDRTFDAAGVMHASNEMIWLHHDEVDGFPTL